MESSSISNLVRQHGSGTKKVAFSMTIKDDLGVVSDSTFVVQKDGRYLLSVSAAVTQPKGSIGMLVVIKNPVSDKVIVPTEVEAWEGSRWEGDTTNFIGASAFLHLN